jgi:hypothetical protein
MNTAAAPENAMADRRNVRFSAGLFISTTLTYRWMQRQRVGEGKWAHKFLEKLARDQSSARREKVIKTGMERRLL